jgi:hypothetical protein
MVALGFIGLRGKDFSAMMLPPYIALIIALRLLEGMLVTQALRSIVRPWHGVAALSLFLALYTLFRQLPPETLTGFKSLWALGGAALAAFQWTRLVAQSPGIASNHFHGLDTGVALFFVFVSTFLCTQSSPFLLACYQWTFPAGILLGFRFHPKTP